MSASDNLAQIYYQRSQETLRQWREPAIANRHDGFYPENLKAIAAGIQPVLTSPISTLLTDLQQQVLDDPLADIMHPDHFHLTFLAITPARYDRQHQPEGVEELQDIAVAHGVGSELTVRELRLVALPNQLLIAGIPDAAALAQRAALWQALRQSAWADALRERYPGSHQPPPFWHSTLLRYDAPLLPQSLQAFFKARINQRYGEITGRIGLRLVTYNWSKARPLA